MKLLESISVTLLILGLASCGDQAADSKTGAERNSSSTDMVKNKTQEEQLIETKQNAEAGDSEAQRKLAIAYRDGEGVAEDTAKAIEWLIKSAEQGNARAQTSLGNIYYFGRGVSKDESKGVELFQKAAAKGNAVAQRRLSVALKYGRGVPKDEAKAFEWLHKSAEQNDIAAQMSLGLEYLHGDRGNPIDAAKGVDLIKKAATQDDNARALLASFYLYGLHVPKDEVKAAELFQKSAAQGLGISQDALWRMYEDGVGVRKNLSLAYAWLNLAAAQDVVFAKENRDLLEKSLTPAQRAEGQRLASNWKKGDILQASGNDLTGATSSVGKLSKQATGTAFVVSNTGHALTNHHVIKDCIEIKVNGREGIVRIVTSDIVNDIALLQLPGSAQDISFFNSAPGKLRQGEDIIVFGYPLQSTLSSGGNLTLGIVSALTGLGNNTNQIQITAPIQPGSSGSPVMDKKGNVVGVVSMKLSDSKMINATGQVGQNVNFAISGQTVKAFLDTNQVPYKTGGGFFSFEKSNIQIADEAHKWTVLLECWK